MNQSSTWHPDTMLIGPLRIAVTSLEEAVHGVCSVAVSARAVGTHVHLVNAYTTALADTDDRVHSCLTGSAINLPDGKPLMWYAKWLRRNAKFNQNRGPDLFSNVFDVGRQYGVKHFLLGSTDSTLARIQNAVAERFPGAEIVGAESPPFRPLQQHEIRAQDERIRASGAQIVWVGLGTPKQDIEANRLARNLPVVAIAIGAAFDFTAGTVKEAPDWIRRIGVEWLYRFAKEPRRLWRRYLIGNVLFLRALMRTDRHG